LLVHSQLYQDAIFILLYNYVTLYLACLHLLNLFHITSTMVLYLSLLDSKPNQTTSHYVVYRKWLLKCIRVFAQLP